MEKTVENALKEFDDLVDSYCDFLKNSETEKKLKKKKGMK